MLRIIDDQPSNFAQNKVMFWVANLFPVYAVWKFDWSLFLVMYIFWFEMLIITAFQVVRIFIAQKPDDENIGGRAVLTTSHVGFWALRLKVAVRYVLIRAAIFLFYLLFMVVFIGYSEHGREHSLSDMTSSMFFRNPFFNLAIANFVLAALLDFLGNYLLNYRYKTENPSNQDHILDSRTLVVHVSIVLGTFFQLFLMMFLSDSKLITLLTTLLFVTIKIVIELSAAKFKNAAIKDAQSIISSSEKVK